jgi:uncharacterized protein YndB with AHSA1/START domain
MLKTIAIVAAVFLVALLGFAATRPDSFRLQRSLVIDAPPDKVFALITDFKQWPTWSPWEKLDPNMARTFTGTERGVGTIYTWDSPSKAGAGRMEIKQAVPSNKVTIQLDFIRPFAARNTTEFTLQAQAQGNANTTQVTWAMSGPNPYLAKLMQVFVSMDSMVGKDFEEGLANLKRVAEAKG